MKDLDKFDELAALGLTCVLVVVIVAVVLFLALAPRALS